VTTNYLLKDLNLILKSHLPDPVERRTLIRNLASQFKEKSYIKISLSENSHLILTKDERKLKNLRRYNDSPLPLLSNVEGFSNSIGAWNEELTAFGLHSRYKLNETPNMNSIGSKIYIAYTNNLNSKGNQYLRRQYKRLKTYRHYSQIDQYWNLAWTLMRKSFSFRLACLNSWSPTWYKEYSSSDLKTIFSQLVSILNLDSTQTIIRNVWIESPKNKWRQLGIPPKGWRLFFHMLNMFLSYIYEPQLPSSQYEGFIYNRGCTSWWKHLFSEGYLDKYSSLVEVDLSSGFPNLSLHTLREALSSDKLLPEYMINLLLTYLKSPLQESTWFPHIESYIENLYNKTWRTGHRSVHMGLGISPILFVISLHYLLQKEKIHNADLTTRWYADDGSFFFNIRGLWSLIRSKGKNSWWIVQELLKGHNLILSLLNDLPSFRKGGIKLCPKKSKLVRICNIWKTSFVCLGLRLYTNLNLYQQLTYLFLGRLVPLELMGYTRGKSPNPITGKPGTIGSRKRLNIWDSSHERELNLHSLITQYNSYFDFLLSYLYNPITRSQEHRSHPPKPKSVLWTLNRNFKRKAPTNLKKILNPYNTGSKLNEILLHLNVSSALPESWHLITPNWERELSFSWKLKPLQFDRIRNPLESSTSRIDDLFLKYSEIPKEYSQNPKHYEEYLRIQSTPPTPRKPKLRPKIIIH